MFGNTNGAAAPAPNRPAASDVARLEGTLTQVIVSGPASDGLHVFQNGAALATGEVESLSIEILAPDAGGNNGSVSAVLSRYQALPAGGREQRASSLFPGTVEVIARGRRLVVTCLEDGSFEGLWLGLGLRADGTSSELSGVGALRLAVAPGLVDAKLTRSEDGTTEDLLPE
jgi:hypothetical protein